jgi:hypothetical protein
VSFDLSGYTNVRQVLIGQNVAAVLGGDGKVRIAQAQGPNAVNDDGVRARYYQQRVSSSAWDQIRAICFSRTRRQSKPAHIFLPKKRARAPAQAPFQVFSHIFSMCGKYKFPKHNSTAMITAVR